VTASKAIMGTPSYMAPEQADGRAREVGPAADVYALGAIFYELLTGRPPFRADTWQATLNQVITEEPVPPSQRCSEIPAELETVCLKCLEKEPPQRYGSARELAEDLRRFLVGQSITAAPINDLERQERWARQAGFEIDDVMTYGVRDAVYKARQVHLNRVVALKIMTVPAQADPTVLERLRQEAKTVALLDHPNIVRIYSSGELHGRTYLAFEYVAGGSLIDRFTDRPVPPREATRLVLQLAEAMQYAHERGILHCALKPSNVLLTPDGLPKITNFGLSRLLEDPEPEQRLVFRRLPSYMAPELQGGLLVERKPATDVYALGAILFKLLTGEPPFLGETLTQTWEQVRSQPAPIASTLQASVPPALDQICQKCLAKEPGARYTSARNLADELARFLAADQPPSSSGTLPHFPDYEVLRELGRGSMSVVYEARHQTTERRVAIKTMQERFRAGKPVRDLLREVSDCISQLRHPNIVQVYECREQAGRVYFVMELLPGGSLDSVTAGTRQMPIAKAAALVRTLARTMDTVHQQGIIHGDLKPSKVLLTADGTPKLTGFLGVRQPHELAPEEKMDMTVRAPTVMGTPRFMAPEQLSGNPAAIGPATDVYALGLILYELLTGWLPFRAAALWDMLAQVLHEAPQPPREIRGDIPANLETICLRCLAKKGDQRYPSAGALADDLDRFLAGEPVLATSLSQPVQQEQTPPQLTPISTGPVSAASIPLQKGLWARFTAWLLGPPRK
jgi:serine/threonine protein kinase